MAKTSQIALIRQMIADGMDDREISDEMAALMDVDAESRAAADFEDAAYGSMDDHYVSERDERISYGRNDAGEWLGFM